jgi:hypothetical protein
MSPDELSSLAEMGALTPCAWRTERPYEELEQVERPQVDQGLPIEGPVTPVTDEPLPDALWLEAERQAPPSVDPAQSSATSLSYPPAQVDEEQADLPPYSSIDVDAYRSVDLELDHERPPLNSFEAALRNAIAGQSDPPPPAEVDMSQYEDLFVFKDIDKEGPEDE